MQKMSVPILKTGQLDRKTTLVHCNGKKAVFRGRVTSRNHKGNGRKDHALPSPMDPQKTP
jgi:hypothetical protein